MEEDIKKEENQSELEELKRKSEEYLNNWKRSAADFINYKKDEMGRTGMLVGYAKEDMFHKILPILDSIDLAEKSLPDSIKSESWVEGFMQIKKQIAEFLKKEGIEEIETEGRGFDPNTMEIVDEVDLPAGEAGGSKSGTVAEELQKGYKVGDKIIRPSRIKINK